MDDGEVKRQILVVPVQDPDLPTPLQELTAVGEPAEDSLGCRGRRDKKAPGPGPHQRPHQDSGVVRGRAVQQGDPGLPSDNGRRQDGTPTGGSGGRSRQWGLSVGEQRTRGAPRTDGREE